MGKGENMENISLYCVISLAYSRVLVTSCMKQNKERKQLSRVRSTDWKIHLSSRSLRYFLALC